MAAGTPSLSRQRFYLWIALLLVAAASIFSFYATNRLIALSERAERSQAILADLNKLLSDWQGIETGARGYVITGNERFLAPYKAGFVEADQTLRRLRRLADEDRRLQARLDRLQALGERRNRLARQLVARRASGAGNGSLIADVEAGKAAMDTIRREIGTTTAAEEAEARARELAVERTATLANLAMALAVGLSLATILWLFGIRGREVSRRREAEAELKTLNIELEQRVEERTAEVQRSRELLDAVVENMPDPMGLKDSNDNFRYILANRALDRMLGMDRVEIIGRGDPELFPGGRGDAIRKEDEEVVATGKPLFVAERPIPTPDGVRMIESYKVPISDSNGGRHRYVLALGRDLTERRALEDQLRQSQRMHAVGRLTGGIAHDFNNILAIILGNVDLLREQLPDGSETADMADEALGAAQHGAELVRRLLAFARMQHLQPSAVDLNERLPAILALLKRALGEAIQLQVKPSDDLWLALVDPTQVDDALVNLAINARDAMPDGGSLTIETGNIVLDEDYAAHHVEVTPGDYVMLAVSDSGSGMSPAVIARAFEPFFTTKAEGKGTGLGLSQVYGWIKQSGGHIKIYSELGHGTTIKLYLPRADAPEETAPAPIEEAAPHRGDETVLVVEDNPKVRATVLRQLADLGYVTLEAEDGESALDVVRSAAAFDLLLTDVVMPGGMTGYELAEAARAVRPGLKILFTSGYTELAAGSGQAGRSGPLLSKPYRKRDLGIAVRAVLDARE